jgi:hypothetical protein
MNHSHNEHAESNKAVPFTEEQREEFHKADIEAGRMIVGLMGGIFTVGVILYGIVAFVVGS